MTTAKDILTVATAELGYTESPPNSNRTKYGKWYGMDGAAWCNMYVSWVFNEAKALPLIFGKHAYTPAHARKFQAEGRFTIGAEGIATGDVVFFAFYGPKYNGRWLGIHHVGIVESVRDDGYIVCIEGNTSKSSNDDGGAVMRRVRNPIYVAGYGRPEYSGVSKKKRKFTLTRKLLLQKPYMTGTDVRNLQTALRAHKVGLVDGVFGPKTDAAVRSFQKSKKLKVDGIVGTTTAAALGWNYKSSPVTKQLQTIRLTRVLKLRKPYMTGPDIERLQRRFGITVDGVFGTQTDGAVKRFQRNNNLKVDGIVGKNTAEALGWTWAG